MSGTPVGRICVFCGSRPGNKTEYAEGARRLGSLLARRNIGLVYGGGSVGLMGVLADAVLENGGSVTGVIPEVLAIKEVAHKNLTDMHVVDSMHERKALMASLSDAFITLPGGFGTFEELFEMVTWAQLGIHRKPFGLLNIGGFFDSLLAFLDHTIEEGFIPAANRNLILRATDEAALLDLVLGYEAPPPVPKWIRPEQT